MGKPPQQRLDGIGELSLIRQFGYVFLFSILAAFNYRLGFVLGDDGRKIFPVIAVIVLSMCVYARPMIAAFGVWLTWSVMWLDLHRWVGDISQAGVIPLAMYLGLFPAAFVALLRGVNRLFPPGFEKRRWLCVFLGALLVPTLWVALDVLRGEVIWGGYAFYFPAHAMSGTWLATALGPWIGVYGLMFVLVGLGFLAWTAILSFRWASWQGVLAITVSLVALDAMNRPAAPGGEAEPSGRPLVAVIQTNVPQDNRSAWTVESRLETMAFIEGKSREAAAWAEEAGRELAFITVPETMFPGVLGLNDEAVSWAARLPMDMPDGSAGRWSVFAEWLLQLQADVGVPIVIGARATEGLAVVERDGIEQLNIPSAAKFNSAFVVAGGRVAETRYDKIHLTPFGEVMPLISRWAWLEQRLLAIGASGMSFDLDAGKQFGVLEVPRGGGEPIRLATPICFEATNSGVVRRLVYADDGERRADVIVNLTNDGWFGASVAGREAHLLAARWRCIELGVPMVRAANTGISVVIDRRGRIVAGANMPGGGAYESASLPVNEAGLLLATLPEAGDRPTVFSKYGNVVGWVCLGVTVAIVGAMLIVPRKRAEGSVSPSSEGASDDDQEQTGAAPTSG